MKIIISVFLSLQLLLLHAAVSGCSVEEQQLVLVVNILPVDSVPMIVNCKYDGHDLGSHVLYHDQDFHYSICDSSQGRVMSCDVYWANKKASFEAFKETGVHVTNTYWNARADGIRLTNSVGDERTINWHS